MNPSVYERGSARVEQRKLCSSSIFLFNPVLVNVNLLVNHNSEIYRRFVDAVLLCQPQLPLLVSTNHRAYSHNALLQNASSIQAVRSDQLGYPAKKKTANSICMECSNGDGVPLCRVRCVKLRMAI